ncbi:tetratricopeptide repeat protein [Corallibacter sp.]|uniref:tetratricopeptide repeat protein n=1 Tax=Corallibacter sp. TaxID=2038084 RepID=UPI003AB74D65
MKNINLALIFLICFFTALQTTFSQKTAIDSLENVLKTHQKKDTIRLNTLNYLAFYNYRNNPPQAIKYIDEALSLAEELQIVKFLAHSYYIKGVVYTEQANFEVAIENYEKSVQLYTSIDDKNGLKKCNNGLGVLNAYRGNFDLAITYYKKALELAKQIDNDETVHKYLYNIGNIQANTGNYKDALINFKKALKVNRETKDSLGILNSLNSIANIYYSQGNYPVALEYHNNSLEIAKSAKDSIGIFQSLNNIGNVYRFQGLNNKALHFYNKALEIDKAKFNVKNVTALKNNIAGIYYDKNEFDKAITYYNESIALSKEINDNVNLATALNGLGFIHLEIDKYTQALSYFKEANTITLNNNNSYNLADSYHGMAEAYYLMKKYDLALSNAEKLGQLSEEQELLLHQKNAYYILANVYEKKGDFKAALLNHQQFKTINDSLFNEESIEKITQLEYEYKYKQALDSASIRELKLTKTVMATSQHLEETQRNLFIGVIAFLMTAIVLGGIIFSLKLRNEKAKTQNIVIEQKLLRSQMTPHFIFNSLSVLQGMILNKEDKKSIFYLSKFSKLLRITLENSRDKMVLLSQELLAIQNYLTLQNLENDAFKHTVLVDDTINVSLFEIPPMLIQPFVENAIEHAFKNKTDDKQIDIKLTYNDKKLICTIADNGIGIDCSIIKSNNKNKSSLATTITAERLAVLSKDYNMEGSVTIEDRKKYNEQGTLVTLVIPHKIILIS